MSTPIFDPEDPKLTAYALGELTDPAERAEVETLLQHSPEARLAMKEIQDLTTTLTAEYDQERQDITVVGTDEPSPVNVIVLPKHQSATRPVWNRRLLAMAAVLLVAGLLAALLLPVIRGGLQQRKPPGSQFGGLARQSDQSWRSYAPLSTTTRSMDEPSVSAVPDAETAAVAPGSLPAGAIADNSKSTIDAAAVESKKPDPGAVAAASPQSVPMVVYQPPPVADRRATKTAVATTSLPPVSTVAPTSVTQPAKGEFQQYPRQPATTSLNPILGSTSASSRVSRAEQPLPPVAQVPAGAPMKPVEMSGLASTGQGMGTTDSGGGETSTFGLRTRGVDRASADARPVVSSSMMLGSVPTGIQAKPIQHDGDFNTAAYDHLTENTSLAAKENPLSTFSIDVDTASYANVRRFLDAGSLPPPDAVRLEELLNYFPYDYAPPAPDSGQAFAVHLEAASCPWAPEHRLVRIGIKGREIATDKRPASNLVFLIDVSGSMEPPERLPLIKRAASMMVEHLTANDHVAIVTYAGQSGVALPSTSGDHKDAILNALDRLQAGGGTNGASGIQLAYQVAREGFIKGGTNRVILATDGDFNVGVTSQGALVRMIQEEAKSGVSLSALGVGTDNYKDSTMQKLADKGNGNYHYIDRLEEARKVLVEQMSGTLLTIAKDVKIQVEFNPAVVGSYRLIGYEKRMLRKEDFNDDRIDAGEIGAGHTVTALYEVVPVGQPTPGTAPAVDALKYGAPGPAAQPTPGVVLDDSKLVASPEMLTLKIRSKAPDAEQSERVQDVPLTDHGAPGDFAQASPDFKFAAAVASFGLVLRDSPDKGGATLDAAVEMAQEGKGNDPKGYRAEFINLVRKAEALKGAR